MDLKIMVGGQIHLTENPAESIKIERCMPVLSCNGRILGMIAAVCFDPRTEEVTAVLLGTLPLIHGYRLIPICLIDRLNEDGLYLRAAVKSAADLEPHHAK